ncbi:MAG TPA: response regulator, partial [Azospirillum sp.]
MPAEPTVFVVDDDDAVRDSLQVLLECAGFRVESFASPADFLASDAPRRAGCLLVDVRMPEMSGLEVQERLAGAGHALPVIVMTGHADVPLAVRAMKAGAVDFVEKPFDDEA